MTKAKKQQTDCFNFTTLLFSPKTKFSSCLSKEVLTLYASIPKMGTATSTISWLMIRTKGVGNYINLFRKFRIPSVHSGTWRFLPFLNYNSLLDVRLTKRRPRASKINSGSSHLDYFVRLKEFWITRIIMTTQSSTLLVKSIMG